MDTLMQDIQNLVQACDHQSKQEKLYVYAEHLKKPCIRAGLVMADGKFMKSLPPFIEAAPVVWQRSETWSTS